MSEDTDQKDGVGESQGAEAAPVETGEAGQGASGEVSQEGQDTQ